MPEKKLIIFDFDGTLADTLPIIVRIVNASANHYGIPQVNQKEVEELKKLTAKELMKFFKVPFYKVPFFVREVQNELGKQIVKTKIFPGMKDVVKELKKRGYKLGILTSNTKDNVEAFLNQYQINAFDFIYPKKSLFSKSISLDHLAKKYHLKKHEVLYIGDEVRDIEACQKSKIDIIVVTWGFNARSLLEKYNPTYLVDKPEEILKIL